MRKSFLAIVVLLSLQIFARGGRCQESSSRQSLGVTVTFAPDSSHILIGSAEQRRTWTTGIEYQRVLYRNDRIKFDYEGSVSPFFQERDPTLIGGIAYLGGFTIYQPLKPTRVVLVNNSPIGAIAAGGPSVPLYPVYGSTETYAVGFSPLGARVNLRPSRRIQPVFAVDLGMVFSSQDLPVDGTANLNYIFSFGPGVEFVVSRNETARVEYSYRHMSNANSGNFNPGLDQGVIRLTISRWW